MVLAHKRGLSYPRRFFAVEKQWRTLQTAAYSAYDYLHQYLPERNTNPKRFQGPLDELRALVDRHCSWPSAPIQFDSPDPPARRPAVVRWDSPDPPARRPAVVRWDSPDPPARRSAPARSDSPDPPARRSRVFLLNVVGGVWECPRRGATTPRVPPLSPVVVPLTSRSQSV